MPDCGSLLPEPTSKLWPPLMRRLGLAETLPCLAVDEL